MIDYIVEENSNRVVALDSGKEIGECVYIKDKNGYNVVHTQVDSNYQGKGIARKMVDLVIELAKRDKAVIYASCSYAKKVIEKHNNK